MSNLEVSLERFVKEIDWARYQKSPVDVEHLAKDFRLITVRLLKDLHLEIYDAGGRGPGRPPRYPIENVSLAVALLQLADAGHH